MWVNQPYRPDFVQLYITTKDNCIIYFVELGITAQDSNFHSCHREKLKYRLCITDLDSIP